jgi:predicted component of type VI protein secretion system
MTVRLVITAGPHAGREFAFDRHDTFLVGRSKDAHLQLSYDDPYFSRRHFLVEVNPPRVRLIDLGSRNGTHVNGQRVETAELKGGDAVKAGHTVFRVEVASPDPDAQHTLPLPPPVGSDDSRVFSLMAGWVTLPTYSRCCGSGSRSSAVSATSVIPTRTLPARRVVPQSSAGFPSSLDTRSATNSAAEGWGWSTGR